MSERRPHPLLSWDAVELQLPNMRPVTGGFSLAKRGIVELPGKETVFVKIGTEENSKRWAKKELAVYEYLHGETYQHIPRLLTEKADETAFALEGLLPEDGWDWSNTWTTERLETTLQAMDALACFDPANESWANAEEQALDASRDGWKVLADTPEMKETLKAKLTKAGHEQIANNLNVDKEFERSSQFAFKTDTLVHYDIRADNCAWNAKTQEVKLVDWNWAQLGDTRIDTASALVNVQRGGYDVLPKYASRLDADALHWIAGFWLQGAATPIWKGGSDSLRDFQLEAAVTSLYLLSKLEARSERA